MIELLHYVISEVILKRKLWLKAGTFGQFASISFNGNKIITTSGDGAVICQNQKDAENARFLATQASDSIPHYQHSLIGNEVLQSCTGISFQPETIGMFSNRWLIAILIDPYSSQHNITRKQIRNNLEAENIVSRPLWNALHLQPVFRDAPYGESISEDIFNKGISLTSGMNMNLSNIKRTISKITSLFK